MPIFKLAKLVRDKIVEDQLALGQKPAYRLLSPEEHKRALIDKIVEEITELSNADDTDTAKELADVQQALDDLAELFDISKTNIAEAQTKKASKSGAFKKGVYIDTLELSESDSWAEYYRKDPSRFPEVS